jgi:hypothetical protein
MGKIWNAITSRANEPQARKIGETTQPAQDDNNSTDRLQTIMKGAGVLAAVLLVVSIVWVFLFAWRNVNDLFAVHLLADPFTATLAAGSSVGMLAVLLLVTFGIQHARMRGLATLYASAWFAIVLALVVVKTIFDAASSNSASVKVIAQSVLDTAPWLANIGNVLAAVLAGLCLAPVASMFGAAKHPADDMTEDEARARYAWNAGKLIISGASIGLAVLFGATVIGINPFIAVLLGLVLDVGFLVALQKAESSANAGNHRQAGTWTKFVWVYGVLIALMAVETIPALARIMGTPVDVPGITDNTTLHSLGRFAYIGAIGMGILTIVLTATSNIRQRRADDQPAQMATISTPRPIANRLADGIRGTRAGIGEIGSALRGTPQPAQIGAPAGVPMASKGAPAATISNESESTNDDAGKSLPATPKS